MAHGWGPASSILRDGRGIVKGKTDQSGVYISNLVWDIVLVYKESGAITNLLLDW